MRHRKRSGKSHKKHYNQASQTNLEHKVHYLRSSSSDTPLLNFLRPGTLKQLLDMYQDEEKGLTPAGSTLPRAKRLGLIPSDAFISKESLMQLFAGSSLPANHKSTITQKETSCLTINRTSESCNDLLEILNDSTLFKEELAENTFTSALDRIPLDSPTSLELAEMYPEVQSALVTYRFFSPIPDTKPFNFDEFLELIPNR